MLWRKPVMCLRWDRLFWTVRTVHSPKGYRISVSGDIAFKRGPRCDICDSHSRSASLIRQIARLSQKQLLVGLLVGVLNSGIAPFLWFTGLKYTTAVNAQCCRRRSFFVLMYGKLFLRESLNRMQVIGAGIALCGVGIMVLGGNA